jgi:phosphatidylglycerol:prolipoprotein diacylglycerol transferase
MYPELLHLGPLAIHSFGLTLALGFLLSWVLLGRLCRGTRWTPEELSGLLVWTMLWGVAGARLAYVLEHWSAEFADRPWAAIRIDQGGLMFYGGLAGAVAGMALFARRRRAPLLELLDLGAVALPLGHAVGRIGCFLNGCCYGRIWDGPGAVHFPAQSLPWKFQTDAGILALASPHSLPLVPVQLIESAANLVLLAALLLLWRKRPRAGTLTAAYLAGYAVIRFGAECLRGDPRMAVGPLSIGQVASLAVVAVAAGLCAFRRRRVPSGQPQGKAGA